MIVSMPDDAVTAQRRPGGNGAEQRKTNPQPTAPTPQVTARDAFGGSLQRLLNVTIDCMRGRYDR